MINPNQIVTKNTEIKIKLVEKTQLKKKGGRLMATEKA